MKFLKKLIVSMSMIFVGLSFQIGSPVEPTVKAEAADVITYMPGSTATIIDSAGSDVGALYRVINIATDKAIAVGQIYSLVVTNEHSYLNEKGESSFGPIEVGSESTYKTDGCNVAAYFYKTDKTSARGEPLYDAIFFADVETIYAPATCNCLFNSWSECRTMEFENFDTSKSKNFYCMFNLCGNLTTIEGINKFDTSNVTDVREMFGYCNSLKELDLSSFDLSKVKLGLDNMFASVDNKQTSSYKHELSVIYAPKEMGSNTITLPSYFSSVAANTTLDSSTENKVIICSKTTYQDPNNSSKTFTSTDLANEVTKLNTCTDYAQAAYYLKKYNALSAEDKARFDMVDSHNEKTTLINKLNYMAYLASTNAQNSPALSYSKMITKEVNYELIAIIALSVVTIFGYQFIQRRKYASK